MEGPAIVFAVYGPIARADLPGLCNRVCRLLQTSDGSVLVCEIGSGVAPDAIAVDALARLELAARRLGCHIRLRDVSPELQQLIRFCGLQDVRPFEGGLRVEPGWQAEEREQAGSVEEERELGDPTV
jgi:hypothetical protein